MDYEEILSNLNDNLHLNDFPDSSGVFGVCGGVTVACFGCRFCCCVEAAFVFLVLQADRPEKQEVAFPVH